MVELRDADDPARYAGHLEVNQGGYLVLTRRADGACTYLGEDGCTIWPNHPVVCRAFDCGVHALAAIHFGEPPDPEDGPVIAAGLARIRAVGLRGVAEIGRRLVRELGPSMVGAPRRAEP